jgi:hypothetical protein
VAIEQLIRPSVAAALQQLATPNAREDAAAEQQQQVRLKGG